MPGGTHQLQRAFNRLGAAVREKRAVQSRCSAKLLGQQSLVLVVIKVGDVDGLRRLVANNLHNARMRVAKRIDAQAGEKVEVTAALDVINVHALAARDGQRVTGIGVQQEFLFAIDDILIGRHKNDLSKASL